MTKRPYHDSEDSLNFTEKEQKLLFGLYKYPSYQRAALLGCPISFLVWISYKIVDEAIVRVDAGRGAHDPVLYALILCIAVYLIGHFLCGRFLLRARKRREMTMLEEKINAYSPYTDSYLDVGQIARILSRGAADRMFQSSDDMQVEKNNRNKKKTTDPADAADSAAGDPATMSAERFLQQYDLPVPNVTRTCRWILCIPLIIMLAVSMIMIHSDVLYRENTEAKINAVMQQLSEDYAYCRTSQNDPANLDISKSATFNFWAYLEDGRDENYIPWLSFTINMDGEIQEIYYMCDVDGGKELSPQFAQCENDFTRLMSTLKESSAAVTNPGMLEVTAFSEEFRQKLASTDRYTPVWLNYSTDTGLRMYESFYTNSEEEYNEYTQPYIYVDIVDDVY